VIQQGSGPFELGWVTGETGVGLLASLVRRIGFDIYRVNRAFGYVLLKHGINFLLALHRAKPCE
jgi:hypothetical protein